MSTRKLLSDRTFITIAILVFIPVTGELHTLWEGQKYKVNYWLNYNYPMIVTWYYWFLSARLHFFFAAVVIFRLTRMDSIARMFATIHLFYQTIGLIMFFFNFNRGNYILIYALTSPVLLMFGFCLKEGNPTALYIYNISREVRDYILNSFRKLSSSVRNSLKKAGKYIYDLPIKGFNKIKLALKSLF